MKEKMSSDLDTPMLDPVEQDPTDVKCAVVLDAMKSSKPSQPTEHSYGGVSCSINKYMP